jgi:hypothetical protein
LRRDGNLNLHFSELEGLKVGGLPDRWTPIWTREKGVTEAAPQPLEMMVMGYRRKVDW